MQKEKRHAGSKTLHKERMGRSRLVDRKVRPSAGLKMPFFGGCNLQQQQQAVQSEEFVGETMDQSAWAATLPYMPEI